MAFNIGPTIAVNGEKEYREAINRIKTEMKLVSAETQKMTSKFNAAGKSQKALRAETKGLREAQKLQKQSIKEAQKALDDLRKKGYAETSQEVVKMKTNLANAQAEYAKTTKQINENNKALKASNPIIKGTVAAFEGLGKAAAAVGKVTAVGVAAVTTAVAALTKKVVSNVGEFEQLSGGVQKIFDEVDFSRIATDAQNAYKTMGLSASQYMEVMTSVGANFAATLGDEKGYDTAKRGMQAITDFATGTGRSVDELADKYQAITKSTSSYQSIADQFAGILPATSADFLKQAQAAGLLEKSYKKLTDVPMAEYQQAVTAMLERGVGALGLTNNTVNEAESTLSGSIGALTASWQNLLTALGTGEGLDTAIQNLVNSAFTAFSNLTPVIATALSSMADALPQIISELAVRLPGEIMVILPSLIQAVTALFSSLAKALPKFIRLIVNVIPQLLPPILQAVTEVLPQLVPVAIETMVLLANTLTENLPLIIECITTLFTEIMTALSDPANMQMIMTAGLDLIMALTMGIIQAIPELIAQLPQLITTIVSTLIQNLPKIVSMGADILVALLDGIVQSIGSIGDTCVQVIGAILDGLASIGEDLWDVGKDAVEGIWNGIKDAATWLWEKLKGWCSSIVDKIKGFFGIKSPSRVFKESVGKFMAEGIGEGFSDEMEHVNRDIKKSLNNTTSIAASVIGGAGGVTINSAGRDYSKALNQLIKNTGQSNVVVVDRPGRGYQSAVDDLERALMKGMLYA